MTKKVLVIYGGTQEPIDGVRHISNFSSGQTGAVIADYLIGQGLAVTVVRAQDSVCSSLGSDILFNSYNDLKEITCSLLDQQHFDSTIMLAAVSDYIVDKIFIDGVEQIARASKIPSGRDVEIKLRSSEKLISNFKAFSRNRDMKLVGFKLTNNASDEQKILNVRNLINQNVDLVVHNDLTAITKSNHDYSIYGPLGRLLGGNSKDQLAKDLYKEII